MRITFDEQPLPDPYGAADPVTLPCRVSRHTECAGHYMPDVKRTYILIACGCPCHLGRLMRQLGFDS